MSMSSLNSWKGALLDLGEPHLQGSPKINPGHSLAQIRDTSRIYSYATPWVILFQPCTHIYSRWEPPSPSSGGVGGGSNTGALNVRVGFLGDTDHKIIYG